MVERSHLVNGRFWHDLDAWTLFGAEYSAGDGDDHFGVAVLADTEYIEQYFSVYDPRVYTVHISAKSTTGFTGSEIQAIITDGEGNQVVAQDIEAGANLWVENSFDFGLGPGTNYKIRIINNSAGEDVKIDDVWLWHIPITRAEIAIRVHDRLGELADDQNFTSQINGSKTEGDYTYPIDSGLRFANAINPETGEPDTRYLDPGDVESVIDETELEALKKLRRIYATYHDVTTGPVSQKFSQVGDAIDRILGLRGTQTGGGSNRRPGRVEVRRLTTRG